MQSKLKGLFLGALLLMMSLALAGSVFAQYDPCLIPPGEYRTYTMGGWGANCNGGNAGCIRDQYFPSVFPSGLTVGGIYTMHFTSAAAVNVYLPPSGNGTPGMLTGSLTDPVSTPSGVFGGQVTALALTLGFSNAGVPGFNPNIGNLIIPFGVHTPGGSFATWTVNQVFALANEVLGGSTANLPSDVTLPDLNSVLTSINQTFDNGNTSTYYLVEFPCDSMLPVEVVSFDAIAQMGSILLQWRTASETDVSFFELSRSTDAIHWTNVARVNSDGNSPQGHSYSYTDASAAEGVHYVYRLTTHDLNGSVLVYDQMAQASIGSAAAPDEYALNQNYPNPFNPTTTISFSLREASHVELTVYDATGRLVATLVSSDRAAGSHTVTFDGSALATGVYFYRIEAGSFNAVRKLALLK